MATVYRDPRARPKINYITTAPFNLNFYNYTQSTNPNTFEVTGALSAVSGVSPSVCPRGRVLRENGKRLFPGGSYPGISTFMVGVYDANSGLSGYIDPNAECFAYYNVDKPVEVVDGVDPSGNVVHRGPSMYTSGNILADGNLDVGGYADVSGNLTVAGTADISGNMTVGTSTANANVVVRGNVSATGEITSQGQIRCPDIQSLSNLSITAAGNTNVSINPALGQFFQFNVTATLANSAGVATITLITPATPAAGSVVYLRFGFNNFNTTGNTIQIIAGSGFTGSFTTFNVSPSRVYGITFVSDGSNMVAVSVPGAV